MRRLYIILLIVLAGVVNANDFTRLYIKFVVTTDLDMNYVNTIADVYKIDGDTAYASVDEAGFYAFKKLEHNFKVIPDPIFATKALTMATTTAEMANWNRYPTHDVYIEMMQNFATNYPNICRMDTLGFSVDGRPILYLKISDNVDIDEDEPEFLYTGQMHGDEVVAYILFLHLADYLLSNYGTNARVTDIVNNIEIYINPLSNPDGTYAGGDNTISGAVRVNANNVDLNRNYPNPVYGDHYDGEAWQDETIMMMNWAEARDFVVSANSHSGIELINYPWDTWSTSENANADDDWWQLVSFNYADTVHTVNSSYLIGLGDGVTQGKDWYEAYGTRQDYMNYFHNCREVTLELSNDKLLDASLLPDHWDYNRSAMLGYMEEALYGIRGIVTDACTGEAIEAKIEIIGHDHDGSEVYASLPVGNYHRPILSGTYDLTFSIPNYETVTVNNVSATNFDITVINVQLNPSSLSVDFTADNQTSCSGIVNFETSIIGFDSFYWDFGDNTTSTEQNPSHLYPSEGVYTVKLIFEMCGVLDSITKTDFINIDLNDAPIVSDVSSCNGATSFSLEAIPVNNGDIVWYDASYDSLSSGLTYTTPVISSSTQFYAQEIGSVINTYVGLQDNSAGGNYFNNDRYLIFDAYQDFTLKSVKVYAGSTSVRTIAVVNSSGTTVYQANVYVNAGEQRVDLNFDISAGTNYQLKIESSNPDLFRNDTGVNYPYEIANVVSITQSSAGIDFYYFFYDWEIEYASSCVSNMAEVNAIIDENVIADFTFSVDMNHVQFTNTGQNATTYSWDFGNGDTSNDENPYYTYVSEGTYIVTLEVSNACGTETYTDTVYIVSTDNLDNIIDNNFIIYPNPAKNILTVFNKSTLLIKELEILDVSGQVLFVPTSKESIDIAFLDEGIYFIRIITTYNNIIIKKFVKEN